MTASGTGYEHNYHPHDQMIENFQALKPHLFTSLVRLDLREQYSYDLFKLEPLLQLWFQADETQVMAKPYLHLLCYGVQRRKYFDRLWPYSSLRFQLKMESIRKHYLTGMYFELSDYDDSYNDYDSLLACRHFEAQLVQTFE